MLRSTLGRSLFLVYGKELVSVRIKMKKISRRLACVITMGSKCLRERERGRNKRYLELLSVVVLVTPRKQFD